MDARLLPKKKVKVTESFRVTATQWDSFLLLALAVKHLPATRGLQTLVDQIRLTLNVTHTRARQISALVLERTRPPRDLTLHPNRN